MEHHPKKRLDLVRQAIGLKHYSMRTEASPVTWIQRYMLAHNTRHPDGMASIAIETFLTHLAVIRRWRCRPTIKRSAPCSSCIATCSTRQLTPPRCHPCQGAQTRAHGLDQGGGPHGHRAPLRTASVHREMTLWQWLASDGMSAPMRERPGFGPMSDYCMGWQRYGRSADNAARSLISPPPGTSLARRTITCARSRARGWAGLFTVCDVREALDRSAICERREATIRD